MKMLLIVNGSKGDIHPFISVGQALKRRGHYVTIISVEYYREVVLEAGLDFISCGPAEDYLRAVNDPDAYSQRLKHTFQFIADWLLLGPMRMMYSIISSFDPKDTILIATNLMLGARLASEKLKYPLVTLCLQPFTLWSVEKPAVGPNGISLDNWPLFIRRWIYYCLETKFFDPYLLPQVNGFRKELGMEDVESICSQWCYSPQKVIGLFPEWFASKASDWPAQTELTGFVHYEEDSKKPLSQDILKFLAAGSPPILITYGTLITQTNDFFEHSIKAARQLGRRCLVLTPHSEQLPALNAANELHASYLPLVKLLHHCDAIIHGGGIGTMSQALSVGKPQLIVPFINDQPDNARRLEKLGLSVTVPIKKYSTTSAITALKRLLNSTDLQLQCLQYAKKINFREAEQRVCESIEQLAHQSETTI